jgi:hypothetical protein
MPGPREEGEQGAPGEHGSPDKLRKRHQAGMRLLAASVRLLPAGRRDLGRALAAEAPEVAAGWRRAAWIAGGLWFVVRESAKRMIGYPLALACAVGVLLWVDRTSSDDGGQFAMAALLAGAALLGFVAPRRAWVAGLVVGTAIAGAHVVYLVAGPALSYTPRPAGLGGAATMLVLIVPAMAGAYLGAGAALLVRRAR